MRGTILGFDTAAGTGAIAGDDGRRYGFAAPEWKGGVAQPLPGSACDYDSADGATAVQVYPVLATRPAAAAGFPGQLPTGPRDPGQRYPGDEKSPIAAGLLALFLGGLGVHKFYLGYTTEGVILLVASIVSMCLWIVLIGLIGTMAIWGITLVEAIIYLTKSETEFRQQYVDQRRPWF